MIIFLENDKIFIFLITFFSVLSTLTSTSKAEATQFSFESFDLTGSQLFVETIGGVNYVNRDIATYGKDNVSSNSSFGRVGVSFGSGVNVASLYFFNNLNLTDSSKSSNNHSINLYNASITVEQVPFEFYPSLVLFLSRGSLLGIRLFNKGQRTKFNSEKK